MKKKAFNCVQMKREGAARVYDLVKDMTIEEELAFWKKGTARLRRRQKALRKKSHT